MNEPIPYTLDLLSNGLCFISRALELVVNPDLLIEKSENKFSSPRPLGETILSDRSIDWKFAIVSLAIGSELIMKERVSQVSPDLLWKDKSKGRTIEWEVARKIVKHNLTKRGSTSELFLNELRPLFRIRNEILHLKTILEEQTIRSAYRLITKNLLFTFCLEELGLNPLHRLSGDALERLLALSECKKFFFERATRAYKELESLDSANIEENTFCELCEHEFLVKISNCLGDGMFDEQRYCLFCGFDPFRASLNGQGCIRCGEAFDKYENYSMMCETCDYRCAE